MASTEHALVAAGLLAGIGLVVVLNRQPSTAADTPLAVGHIVGHVTSCPVPPIPRIASGPGSTPPPPANCGAVVITVVKADGSAGYTVLDAGGVAIGYTASPAAGGAYGVAVLPGAYQLWAGSHGPVATVTVAGGQTVTADLEYVGWVPVPLPVGSLLGFSG